MSGFEPDRIQLGIPLPEERPDGARVALRSLVNQPLLLQL
jgi:hypothetical protein